MRKNNIIQFPNKVETNLEDVIKETIDKCCIKEPKIKICADCGKILKEDDVGGKTVEFIYGSTPVYTCKKCEEINNGIFEFLCYVNQVVNNEKDIRCDWSDFMNFEIKKLLKRKTPTKYIKKHKIKRGKDFVN